MPRGKAVYLGHIPGHLLCLSAYSFILQNYITLNTSHPKETEELEPEVFPLVVLFSASLLVMALG